MRRAFCLRSFVNRSRLNLLLQVLEAKHEGVRLLLTTPMSLTFDGEWEAGSLHAADALATAATPGMDSVPEGERLRTVLPGVGRFVLSERGRFFLSTSPVGLLFIVVEWLRLTGSESFAQTLSFGGVIAGSLIGGIFPVLLLTASGNKGECVSATLSRSLRQPWLKAGIYLLFLLGLVLHGLLIWQDPLQRAFALLVSLLVVGATISMRRRGAFAQRVVVELQNDVRKGGQAAFAITASGEPAPADVSLGYPNGERQHHAAVGEIPAFSSLRYLSVRLPATQATELKIWVHQITSEGQSEGLPAQLDVNCGGRTRRFDLQLSHGQVVLPLPKEACWVQITMVESTTA